MTCSICDGEFFGFVTNGAQDLPVCDSRECADVALARLWPELWPEP